MSFRICEVPYMSGAPRLRGLSKADVNLVQSYRGVARFGPEFFSGYEEAEEINRFVQEKCPSGVIHEDYHQICDAFDYLCSKISNKQYELIEIARNSEGPSVGKYFLGYDITCDDYHSLIDFVVIERMLSQKEQIYPVNSSKQWLNYLLSIVVSHFRSKLNHAVLFDNHDDAEQFREVILGLNPLDESGLWENQKKISDFEVVSLYKVS